MADENSQYLISADSGVCERLPLDSRFVKKLMRGEKGNQNAFVTQEQSTVLAKYRPTTKWTKDERIVYREMQNYIDKTGEAPTVEQLKVLTQRVLPDGEAEQPNGLSIERVQRALNKLQKRGVVFTVI